MNFSTEKFNKGKHNNFNYFEMEKVEFDASNDFCTNPERPVCNLSSPNFHTQLAATKRESGPNFYTQLAARKEKPSLSEASPHSRQKKSMYVLVLKETSGGKNNFYAF